MKLRKITLGALALLAIACQKDPDSVSPLAYSGDIKDMQVPNNFSYNTTDKVSVNVHVDDLFDQPLSGVMVNFYTADPAEGGQVVR